MLTKTTNTSFVIHIPSPLLSGKNIWRPTFINKVLRANCQTLMWTFLWVPTLVIWFREKNFIMCTLKCVISCNIYVKLWELKLKYEIREWVAIVIKITHIVHDLLGWREHENWDLTSPNRTSLYVHSFLAY